MSVHMMVRSHHSKGCADKRLFRLPVSSCVMPPPAQEATLSPGAGCLVPATPIQSAAGNHVSMTSAFVGTDAVVDVKLRCGLLMQGQFA